MEVWLVPLFFVGFVLMWCFVSWVIAQTGWSELAAKYPATHAPDGRWFWFKSAYVGAIHGRYSGCLMLVTGTTGLRMATIWPFRVGHRPMLIPWEDIRAVEIQSWWNPRFEFHFTKCPSVWMSFPRRLGLALLAESHGVVSVERSEDAKG